jgi:glycine cleavage system aminomethyltransferase T
MPPGSFYKPKFFDFMREEYLACREGVGIIDMSSFSKIEIKVSTLFIRIFFNCDLVSEETNMS